MNISKFYKSCAEWSGAFIFLSYLTIVFGLVFSFSEVTKVSVALVMVGSVYPLRLFLSDKSSFPTGTEYELVSSAIIATRSID
ncbi:MAG: hypothetical protein EOO52_13090 [Gammaproteobacteria bacterium]|nr:MAG: hypothetical protein EOO52_13090 [Gammaproteobacteria bacterium]